MDFFADLRSPAFDLGFAVQSVLGARELAMPVANLDTWRITIKGTGVDPQREIKREIPSTPGC